MKKKYQPVVVVTHQRDWPLLELLANSLTKYLDLNHPLYVVTNDTFFVPLNHYKNFLTPLLNERKLIIIDQNEFNYIRPSFPQFGKSKYQVQGWVNQQILKLAISSVFPASVKDYLVLDCQNFLTESWEWPSLNGTPFRYSPWSMHNEIWDSLCEKNDIKLDYPIEGLATPFFFNRKIVIDMINNYGGLVEFSKWFANTGHLVSEFATYLFWAKINNRWIEHKEIPPHTIGETHPDWAIGYLRDGDEFNRCFDEFVEKFSTRHKGRSWASINHRAWSQMSMKQYEKITRFLKDFNLNPKMSELRND